MQVTFRDENTLVLVSRPWATIALLSAFLLGASGLGISALIDGQIALGIALLIVAAAFCTGLLNLAVFEQVRLDRNRGVVEVSGRSAFQAWSHTHPLERIEGARVLSQPASGRRRRTYLPVLMLHDPDGGEIPLGTISSGRESAQRAAMAIADWMNGAELSARTTTYFATPIAIASLAGVNLSAIFPVITGHWSVWQLVAFYWVELLVVSVLFTIKALILMFTCEKRPARDYMAGVGLLLGWCAAWIAATYFTLQDMPFLRGQTLVAFIVDSSELLVPIAAMTAGHLLALGGSLFSSGSLDLRGVERFGEHPFPRIIVLALTIMIVPPVMGITGMPALALLVIVGIKLWLDWRASNVIDTPRAGDPLT